MDGEESPQGGTETDDIGGPGLGYVSARTEASVSQPSMTVENMWRHSMFV